MGVTVTSEEIVPLPRAKAKERRRILAKESLLLRRSNAFASIVASRATPKPTAERQRRPRKVEATETAKKES